MMASAAINAATIVLEHPWTICHSAHEPASRIEIILEALAAEREGEGRVIPPSQWDEEVYRKHCFLHRNDKSSAPGTALFQHWLSDYGTNNESGDEHAESADNDNDNDDDSFDPWNDFPNYEIMRQYPDIGEDEKSRDYYTLWYTTVVDPPPSESNLRAFFDPVFSDEDVEIIGTNNVKAEKCSRRGHLTLHGVNYQPIVYFDGNLLQPYSTSPGDNSDNDTQDENAGGMFLRRHYDLGLWGAREEKGEIPPSSSSPLEILVLPPPVTGKSVPLNSTKDVNSTYYGLEDGQGGDHNLAQSGAIMQFTAGWDWIQSTPDRNVGIWDRVEIEWIWGDVRLHDLHVKVLNVTLAKGDRSEHSGRDTEETALPLGDDVTVSAWLDVTITTTYHGNEQSGNDPIKGELEYWITPSAQSGDMTILASGTIHDIEIQSSVTDHHLGKVFLPDAKLWWPHTHSKRNHQPLYSIHVTFRSYGSDDGNACIHESQAQTTFGVRTISSFIHPQTKSFALKMNGHPIFLTGGNWITTDQFLRYADSPERYLHELSLLRHVGINSIRVWGGGVAETQHFYDAADLLGLLVYQEFWMTGDNNGRWAGNYDWPVDHGAYLANVKDTIKRLRNHPSLSWYGGGNEMSPIPPSTSASDLNVGSRDSQVSPPKDIEEGLKRYIAELDGGRPYTTSSVSDVGDEFNNSRVLAPKDGPYGIQTEEIFFDRNPGFTSPLLNEEEINHAVTPAYIGDKNSPGRQIGFQTEVGSVSHPELESLERILSPEALNSYPDCGEQSAHGASIHEEWTYYKYLPFTENSGLDRICQFAYPPYNNITSTSHRMDSIEDYSWAAQFAQYIQYKSLFEGYTHRMWEWYSAVFLWKASSPAPTFRGALYDWHLTTNGGYWGARAGLSGGGPVRLILNLQDWTVHVLNMIPIAVSATSVKWSAYSLDGVLVSSGEIPIPGEHIDGDFAVHLKESLPWVGKSKVFTPNPYGVQDIILYRLELSYVPHDDLGIARSVKNSYHLTDPSASIGGHSQSRFSLLGAMRKEIPRVKLDLRCEMLANSGIECTLQNAASNGVAVMIKLSLVRNYVNGLGKRQSFPTLSTLFSDNYLTLLPGEASRVNISIQSNGHSRQRTLWTCTQNGLLKPVDGNNSNLIMLANGWNVQESKVEILCATSSTAAVS